MAVISFTKGDADTVFLRNAILRMILSRAQKRLVDATEIDDLELCKAVGAVSFDLLGDDQRARLLEAVYQGTLELKHEVTAGQPTEEPVRAGIEEKLDEILALLSCFRDQAREIQS